MACTRNYLRSPTPDLKKNVWLNIANPWNDEKESIKKQLTPKRIQRWPELQKQIMKIISST